MSFILYFVLGAALAYLIWVKSRASNRGLRALPEPPGALPYIGHALSITKKPHVKFTEWSRIFGDIYMVRIGQLNVLILSSDEVIHNLIVKRGSIYSSRISSTLFHQIITRGLGFAVSPYNQHYKMAKAMAVKVLASRKAALYAPKIEQAARRLTRNLLKDPQNHTSGLDPREHYTFFSTSIIYDVVGNAKFESVDDPVFIRHTTTTKLALELLAVENAIIDFFPVLKYWPFLSIIKKAYIVRNGIESNLGEILQNVRDDPEKRPCLMRDYVEAEYPDIEIIHSVSAIIAGGTDTVASSLYWLTAILANEVSIQSRIHEELDRVVGRDRLPVKEDELNLPYLRATIREGQRFRPVAPLGVPHFVEQDDEYNGFHIPKNTMVIMNAFGIHGDERRYPNAHQFEPERYLGIEKSSAALLNGPSEERDHFAFGGGRRACVGAHMAETELFMVVATLLWSFRIEHAPLNSPDEKPAKIDIDSTKSGLVSWPNSYRVCFVPRHENVERLFESTE